MTLLAMMIYFSYAETGSAVKLDRTRFKSLLASFQILEESHSTTMQYSLPSTMVADSRNILSYGQNPKPKFSSELPQESG